MRTAFIQTLMTCAEYDERIFLICGDLGYSVLEPFAQRFPSRFLNAGIAEQNMIGIAAGLAMDGYKVFVYSIGNFPTLRPMEQIRYDVCYHNLDVKIVAVGGGYSYGPLGVSHHATEEIGMLRTLPNLVVCAPGCPVEARLITDIVTKHKGPCYIRIGKTGEAPVLNNATNISIGQQITVIKGNKILVIASGSILKYAFDFIQSHNKDWELWSAPFIKPFAKDLLIEAVARFDSIITIEEHQLNGGLGSTVLEALNDLRENADIKNIPFVKRIGIPDVFMSFAGSQSYLRNAAGLKLDT